MNDAPAPSLSRGRGSAASAVLIGLVILALAAGVYWFTHRSSPAGDKDAADSASAADRRQDGGQDKAQQEKGQDKAQDKTPGRGSGRRGGPDAAPPVVVATAQRQDVRVTRNALGTVTPLATVTIQAQVSGQLTQVAFTEGQFVHKGDFLAQIDPRPYEAVLAQTQGQLAKDKAALEEARMDLQRYQDLIEKKSIIRQQAEDQKWVVQQDEGAVRVDQAQVDAAQINVNFCHIVAPSDGRIGLRLVDPGNVVQANTTSGNLAVITRMQPMTVVFGLPEDDLPAVLARQHAGASLLVQVFDRSGVQLLDTGTLLAIDSQINTSTGTVNLKAQFPNARFTLFPNQFVNVVLRVETLAGATTIPSAGIQRGTQGSFVYLVKPDNTVAVTPVKVGPSDGGTVAIFSGLKAGDRVVIDGADKLRDGATVKIPGDRGSGDRTPGDGGSADSAAGDKKKPGDKPGSGDKRSGSGDK